MSHLQTGGPNWPQPTYYPPPGPPPRRTGRTLLIVVAVVVVCVGVLAAGAITVLNRKHSADGSGANPGSQPPPTAALPVRTKLYGKPASACSLIGSTTVQSVYPGATGEEVDQDTELDNAYYSRECRFSAGGKGDFGMRFMTVQLDVTTGQDALFVTKGTYPGFVAHLPKSVNIRQIEGQKTVPGYGDEAHLIYGIDSESCRSAFLYILSQNATMMVQYGGCNNAGHMDLRAIDQTTTLNGVYTVAHEALSHLISGK
ncbi:hypothetical protein ACIA58_15520 [Kribbella sp. NPDC051586]|uniref:hypothetical protein n=1 Tax=Kribbella sp. NPDC051586 TaxID=3364118 RepID=UPI0037A52AFC